MRKSGIFILIAALLAPAGCSKDKKPSTAADENGPKLVARELVTEGLDLEEIDINNDGRTDQFIYSKDGVPRYVVRDFNFDGIRDMTEFYEDGVHCRDEIDLDYDGICDMIVTYKDGAAVKKDYSIDFQGNRHGTQYFDTKGNLTEIRRDTDADGTLDVIEYYNPGEETPYKTSTISKKDTP